MSAKTTTSNRVECDRCGIKVRLRKDGTVAPHEYTTRRMDNRFRTIPGTRRRVECDHSGKPYAFHMGTFWFSRVPGVWVAQCRCGEAWTGAEYDDASRLWAAHSRAAAATAVSA